MMFALLRSSYEFVQIRSKRAETESRQCVVIQISPQDNYKDIYIVPVQLRQPYSDGDDDDDDDDLRSSPALDNKLSFLRCAVVHMRGHRTYIRLTLGVQIANVSTT